MPAADMHTIDTSLWLQPHHDGSAVHVRQGTEPALGSELRVRLRVPTGAGAPVAVWLRSLRDGEPHFEAAIHAPGDETHAYFEAPLLLVNPVQCYRWYVQYRDHHGCEHHRWLNAAGWHRRDVPDAFDFRIHTGAGTPDWVKESIMYEVFPDRFENSGAAKPKAGWMVSCDWDTAVQGTGEDTSRQFYGGDLPGIESRLGHLAALGATVLYLTPVFPAASNHRYDASSFDEVDPLLGGDAALISLVASAHARGLRVVGDLTANHTGAGHHWFVDAYQNPASPTGQYYYFNQDHSGYEAWLGVSSLPKLNWNSVALRERFIVAQDSVAVRWLKEPFNLDGWRIDVGNMTGRRGSDDLNHEVARMLRRRIEDVKPGAMLLAESTSDAAHDVPGDGWQGVLSYSNFTRPLWQWLARDPDPEAFAWFFGLPQAGPARIDAEDFVATHREMSAGFDWEVRLANANALDTHDTARAASHMIAGGQELAACAQFSFPGIPLVFAGDEFGLHGFNGEDSRTPMPWDEPEKWGADLRGLYSTLARLRTENRALVDGSLRFIQAEGNLLVYLREHATGSVLCLVARGPVAETNLGVLGLAAMESDTVLMSVGTEPELAVNEEGELLAGFEGPGAVFLRSAASLPWVSPAPGGTEVAAL
ncbi:glycoside hydrolase family 13 protein [Paeniglutamicibacter gangotriensis]|uniref:Glycoside hydrolase family 13 protein n=1 Tax=Paeniglutamicibacter gangotriensis TaxID=254787 RepID=A0A5B0EMR5_9MICC|nr:glycoside hydrolase family 13 protein [Paeniglutamicibacter gangotriensis]KAA0979050.1 glycoside hydrolase family 13 protein [Paeniglutamicibacter gangotriensis]